MLKCDLWEWDHDYCFGIRCPLGPGISTWAQMRDARCTTHPPPIISCPILDIARRVSARLDWAGMAGLDWIR